MFGYLIRYSKELTKEDNDIYGRFYCGLCHKLADKYKERKTLSYDMTFLAILLTNVYQLDIHQDERKCPFKPFKKFSYYDNQAIDYACDCNIILSYYKYLDDANDDNSFLAKKNLESLEPVIINLKNQYPELFVTIKENLGNIAQIEKDNIYNADLGCDYFGKIMAKIVGYKEDQYQKQLEKLGYHLGRFIYLLDAIMDLKKDLRKNNYNPLKDNQTDDYESMLEIEMAELKYAYSQLPIGKFQKILDNILYKGIWMKYIIRFTRRKKQ